MLISMLGRDPELVGIDLVFFEHFWRCRSSTPSDHPINPMIALELYRLLYGEVDAIDLLDKLSAMDGAYAEHVNRQHESKMKKRGD